METRYWFYFPKLTATRGLLIISCDNHPAYPPCPWAHTLDPARFATQEMLHDVCKTMYATHYQEIHGDLAGQEE